MPLMRCPLLHPGGKGFQRVSSAAMKPCTIFSSRILSLGSELADKTACSMEHALPAKILVRLTQFVKFVESWPDCFEAFHLSINASNPVIDLSVFRKCLRNRPKNARDAAAVCTGSSGREVASSSRAAASMQLTIKAVQQALSVGTNHMRPGHTPGEKHEKRGMPRRDTKEARC